MANNKPLTSEEKLEIVALLKKGSLSHREIAQRFKRAQSTVSAIARDSGITPSHRRRRFPAAKDLEGSFTREERINLTDRVLGVIGAMVEGGGLNPRELRETTQALKQTLDARRSEDVVSDSEEKKPGNSFLIEEFASEDSPGIEISLDTPVGQELYKLKQELDAGIDPWSHSETPPSGADQVDPDDA